MVGLGTAAAAAPEDIELTVSPIENLSKPGTNVVLGDTLLISGTWDATNADPQPGDQYTITLPDELDLDYAIGHTFKKSGEASDGGTYDWSECVVTSAKDLTCTLLDAVADFPEDVKGTFEFEVEAVKTTDSKTVEFDLNGTKDDVDLPGPDGGITDGIEIPGEWSKSFGGFTNHDRNEMSWRIEVPGAALQASGQNPVTITDAISGRHGLCSLDADQFSVTTARGGDTAAPQGDVNFTVTDAQSFTIKLSAPFAADRTYVISYTTCTDSDGLDPTGTEYLNTADISIDGLAGDGIGRGVQDWAPPAVSKAGSNLSRESNNDSVYRWEVRASGATVAGKNALTVTDTLTGAHELFTNTAGEYELRNLAVFEYRGPGNATNITNQLTLKPSDLSAEAFTLDLAFTDPARTFNGDHPYWYIIRYETTSTYEGLPPGGTELSNSATVEGGASNTAKVTVPKRANFKSGSLNTGTREIAGETFLPYTTLDWYVEIPGEKLNPYEGATHTGQITLTDVLSGPHGACEIDGKSLNERLNLVAVARDQVGSERNDLSVTATAAISDDGALIITLAEPDNGWDREYRYSVSYTTCTTSGGMDQAGTTYGNSIEGTGIEDSSTVTQERRGGGTGSGGASRGSVSISKKLTDDSVSVPDGTAFTVLVEEYAPGTYPDGDAYESYRLQVPLNGAPVNGQNARGNGWIFVLSEPEFPQIDGVTAFVPVFSAADGVVPIEEGAKAEVSIAPRANAQVTLTNKAVAPSIDIEKWNDEGEEPEYDASGKLLNDGYAGDFDDDSKALVAEQPLPINFTISNDGNEALNDVKVSDELTDGSGEIKDLVCTFPDDTAGTEWDGPFEVGTQFSCTGTLPALQAGETHANTATVVGVGIESGADVEDEDDWNGYVPDPSIDIEKWNVETEGVAPEYDPETGALLNDGYAGDFDDDSKSLVAGQPLPINFTISNDGDEDLVDIKVSDELTGGVGSIEGLVCAFPDGSEGTEWAGPFEVATQFSCTGTLPALANGDTHADLSKVTAIGIDSRIDVDDEDPWSGHVKVPGIDIEKWTDEGEAPEYDDSGALLNDGYAGDFDSGKGRLLVTDESQTINFTISNDGTEALTDVVVSDALTGGEGAIEDLLCVFPDDSEGTEWDGPFEVGTQFSCTGVLPGLPSGVSHVNTATVTGVGIESGTPVDDEDDWNGYVPDPSIDIEKWNDEGDEPEYDASGKLLNDGFAGDFDDDSKALVAEQPLPINFTISNDGDEDLVDVVVSDELTDGEGAIEGLVCTFPDGSEGTEWAGPFTVGTQFDCTGTLPALPNGATHADLSKVTGIGIDSLIPVDDDDPWAGHVPDPSIDIEKWNDEGEAPEYDDSGKLLNDGFAGDFDDDSKALVAEQPLPINFTISNDGDEDLVDVVVSDELTDGEGAIEGLVCTFPDGSEGTEWAGPFTVGTQFDCTGTLPALPNGATHSDTATVTAVGIDSRTPVDDEDEWGGRVPAPSIDIEKWNVETEGVGPEYDESGALTNDGYDGDFDAPRGKAMGVGENLLINFTISNDGNEVLEDIVVSDELTDGSGVIEDLYCVFPDGSTGTEWAGPFEIAVQFDCTGMLPALGEGERHSDLAKVTGVGVDSRTEVDDEDSWNAYVPGPSIDIEKWNDEGEAPEYDETGLLLNDGFAGDFDDDSKELVAGTETTLRFTVSNDGEEALIDVAVSDELTDGVGTITDLVCVFPDGSTGTSWDGPFDVGTQFECAGTLPALNAGESHADLAKVTGVGITSGIAVGDEDEWSAAVPPAEVATEGPNEEGTDAPEGSTPNTGVEGSALLMALASVLLLGGGGALLYARRKRVDA